MDMSQRRIKRPMPAVYRGSGGSAAGSVREVPQPDGTTLVEISVNLADAPVPEREYHAEVARVNEQDHTIRVAFAQRDESGELTSIVRIILTPDAAKQFLATCQDFLPKVDQYLARIGMPLPTLLSKIPNEPPPGQSATMLANLVGANHVGREATLDFYRMSAADVRRAAATGGRLAVEPLVRITLMTELMISVIRAIVTVAKASEPPRSTP